MNWNFGLIKLRPRHVPDPQGFSKSVEGGGSEGLGARGSQLQGKLMEIATAGKSSIFSSFIMLWLLVSSSSIYFIMIVGQNIYSLVNYFLSAGKVFAPYENMRVRLTFYKLIYLAIGLLQLAIVLYKMLKEGLLPFNAYDWIDLVPLRHQPSFIVS